MADTKTAAKRTSSRGASSKVWTEEERAAMQEHAREMKAAARRGRSAKADGEADLLAKVAEMPESDRIIAEKIHALVKAAAPELESRTWYGMPAWAKDGKVLCFFTPAAKFKERYATLGFNATANLDEGTMWPTAWALTDLTPAAEAQIRALLERAVAEEPAR